MNFGDTVTVSAKLTRFHGFYGTRNRPHIREWRRLEFSEPRTALYVGYRTVSNGCMEDLSVYGLEWVPKEYMRVASVVFNERENPVYAFFEDVETLGDQRERCKNTVDIEITAVFKDGLTQI